MAEKLYRVTAEERFEIPEEEADAIRAEWAKNDAKREATKYSRDRQSAYPSWQEQMDMQYHDAVDGTTTWQDAVKAVKEANPKPE
jgi:hypothetical protein